MAYGDKPPGCPPDIDAVESYGDCWPSHKAFPFTAEEALWILKGYGVLPSSGPVTIEEFLDMPCKAELMNGRFVLWRS